MLVVVAIIAMATLTAVAFTAKRSPGGSSKSADALVNPEIPAQVKGPGAGCNGFVVRLDPNEHQRLISEGVKNLGDREVVNKVLEVAKRDPRILGVYSRVVFGDSGITEDKIVQGDCFSPAGQEAWWRLKGALDTSSVSSESAPPAGTNTGANAGGGSFQDSGGIGGDREATKVTLKNGRTFWILHRCGNAVVEGGIPGIPTGTQDNEDNGKNAGNDVLVNPDVPEQVTGCGGAGCGGNTAGPAYQPPPPPPPPRPRPVPPATTVPGPGGGPKPVATAPQPPAPAG